MADFPSTTSAYGVWSLNEIRNAIRGDNWPVVALTDEYFANVSLLLHGDGTNGAQNNTFLDSSANGFTITRNGNTTQGSFSPYSVSGAYDPATHGGSGYFDGTGDYLDAGSNAAYAFGTGDFTIECWFYRDGDQNDLDGMISTGTSAPTTSWQLGFGKQSSGIGTNASLAFLIGGEFDFTLNSSSLNNFQWYHAAVTRSGTTVRLFVDGVLVDSGTNSNDLSTQLLRIGINRGGSSLVKGYLSDVRLVKGTALYTANFTPPTAPLTAITNTSLLCNFTNAGIFDSTGRNFVYTVGDAQIDTAVTKFGTGSMQFDGTGDWLYPVDNTDFVMGTGDFTIEMWINVDNFSDYRHLYDDRVGGNGAYITIRTNLSGQLEYVANAAVRITGSTVMSAGSWYHVAVCRSGTSTRMFLDGVQQGSTYNDSTNYISNTNRPVIAAHGFNTSQYPYIGYMDDIRVTKGVARYTANFTPPTAPFPDQ